MPPVRRRQIPPGLTRAKEWGTHDIKEYTAFYFYILDFEENLETEPETLQREHQEICALVRDFFDDKTDFEIIRVSLPQDWTRQDWNNYWTEEFDDKGTDDLVFFYYHGMAYEDEREAWRFKFRNDFARINVREFLNRVKIQDFDAKIILEVPDIQSRTYLSRNYKAMTEIILAPWRCKEINGQIVHWSGDYGRKLVANLTEYLQDVQAYVPKIPYFDWKFQSIPMLLAADKALRNNRYRVLNHEARKQREDLRPWRIMTDPVDDASTGRIKFYGKPSYPRDFGDDAANPAAEADAADDDDDDGDEDEGIEPDMADQANVAAVEEIGNEDGNEDDDLGDITDLDEDIDMALEEDSNGGEAIDLDEDLDLVMGQDSENGEAFDLDSDNGLDLAMEEDDNPLFVPF